MSTLNPFSEEVKPGDDYADRVTNLRLYREDSDDPECQWSIDGFDKGSNAYTEAVWSYPTFEAAVQGFGDFIAELQRQGIELVTVSTPITSESAAQER